MAELSLGWDREKVTDWPVVVLVRLVGSRKPEGGGSSWDEEESGSSDRGEGVRGASGMGRLEDMVLKGEAAGQRLVLCMKNIAMNR